MADAFLIRWNRRVIGWGMERSQGLAELLAWYVEMGLDEAIGDAPVDRFAAAEAAASAPQPARPVPPAAPPSAAPARRARAAAAATPPPPGGAPATRDEAERSARGLAAGAADLEALRDAMAAFDGCALKRTASTLVFGDGNPEAAVMFVGEAPGGEEDRRGVPFVGPAGQLLDRMLAAIGLSRSAAYIANILPWRPPGNRSPTDSEIAACLPFIERHIELVAPRVLIPVGGIAAKTLLGTNQGIMRLRGRWLTYQSAGMAAPIPARAILHPAYLLRSPAQKRETWIDLIAIRRRLERETAG